MPKFGGKLRTAEGASDAPELLDSGGGADAPLGNERVPLLLEGGGGGGLPSLEGESG